MEFWEHEAYIIAEKVTGGNPIYRDLVSHVYLLVYDLNIPSIDLPRVFARYSYNQYNWRDSTFNKQYRINDPLPELYDKETEQEYHETEMQKLLDSYMDQSPTDDQEVLLKGIKADSVTEARFIVRRLDQRALCSKDYSYSFCSDVISSIRPQ